MGLIKQTVPYVPKSDAGKRAWLNNFADRVAADPARYALTAADAKTLAALAKAYDRAYDLANDPRTKNPGMTAEKDAARNQAVATFRTYAMQIKRNLGIPDAWKLELGIHLDDRSMTPIPAPTTAPILHVVSAQSGMHTLRYADSQTPSSRAKAPGSIALELVVAVGDEATSDVHEAIGAGLFTQQPFQIEYEAENAGKVATYFGRWVTRRGLTGPWSLPVSMTIAFGGRVKVGEDGERDAREAA